MSDAIPEILAVEISFPLDRVVLVTLAGELDLVSVTELRSRIAEVQLQPSVHVVIDLSGLSFVDSTGVNALIQAVRRVEESGGTAVLAAPSPITSRVFEIARVGQLVHLELDRDRALVWRPVLVDANGSVEEPP